MGSFPEMNNDLERIIRGLQGALDLIIVRNKKTQKFVPNLFNCTWSSHYIGTFVLLLMSGFSLRILAQSNLP